MLLPVPVNRASLRGFWLFISITFGALIALLWPGGGSWISRALGAVLVVGGVAIPGITYPPLVWWPYRIWNWLARRLSRLAARYITAVSFWTVIAPLKLMTRPRSFDPRPPGSTWTERGTQGADSYPSQYHRPVATDDDNTESEFTAWRRISQHEEAWALSPFLFAIRITATDTGTESTSAHNIYTLY
jgi:hypothetical protein